MPNKQLANTVLEYSRRGSNTTLPISSDPQELQDLWNRGNEEGISMIKVRKLKERYETIDGKSFRVHNYGKVSLNEILPKNFRTGKKTDEVRFADYTVKAGETNPTMTILRVPNTYKTKPNFNRDIESSFKALNLNRSYDSSLFRRFLKRVV